jgi:hypothetical protein
MSIDIAAKKQAVAQIIEGRVIDDDPRVAVLIKGSVLGFPATLQAIGSTWPFGVMYLLETQVVDDPNKPTDPDGVLKLTFTPRIGRGFLSFFTHVFLFESKGRSVGDKPMESRFIFDYNSHSLSERFIKYPGVSDILLKLEQYSKFTEMTVKTDAGLYLSQPKSFQSMDLDVCRETFKLLGELGQVVFEAF